MRLQASSPRRSCGHVGSYTAWNSSRDDRPRCRSRFAADERVFRIGPGRNAELRRIRHVAGFDEAVLTAARHTATARRPREERLAFRTSIPRITMVSELAAEALDPANWRVDAAALRLAEELAGAGVLGAWILESGRVVVVPRPDLTIADGELHALDRPAVRWPEERLWFWKGLWIAESVATRREQLGPADVFAERNLERRRVMVDVLGFESLARAASGGEPAQQDDYGRLWRLGPLLDDEEYVAVEVVNSTPEPDGSFRRYFLRVPPATKTARAGVAWSFELSVRDYVLTAQS